MSEMCVNIEEVEKIVENRAKLTESEMRGQFNLINEKLDRISDSGEKTLTQARKTNGRVDILEDDVRDLQEEGRTHYTKCPSADAIRALEDKSLADSTIKATLWKVGAMIIGAISLLMSIFAFVAGYI